jgi:ABC-type branched-subunit amino acid transport system permease subunit
MGRIHAWVIGSWTVAWGVTVFVVSFVFPDTLAWWILGGVLTAIPPVIGAVVVARRTRR